MDAKLQRSRRHGGVPSLTDLVRAGQWPPAERREVVAWDVEAKAIRLLDSMQAVHASFTAEDVTDTTVGWVFRGRALRFPIWGVGNLVCTPGGGACDDCVAGYAAFAGHYWNA